MAVLRVTLNIPPGHLAINSRNTISGAEIEGSRIVKTKRYRKAQAQAYLQVRQAVILQRWRIPARAAVLVVTHWGTELGDVDACEKAVLDALQAGRVVENDLHLAPVVLDYQHSSPDPRIEVIVATSIAELVPLLGWDGVICA